MKIMITYPPLESSKGVPLLSQNRQFQYFKEPTYIYPVIPATAATLLKNAGFEVAWLDGIAGGLTYADFIERLKKEKPDVVAMETKTPVIKQHWRIIDDIKRQLLTVDGNPTTVLFGDHVTALPEESMKNSLVDFVLTGGDYDFLLLNLCQALCHGPWTADSEQKNLEPGIWYRDNGEIKNSGEFQLNHDLNAAPLIDRELTRWRLYATKNGNFRRTPGTYIMAGRDCWWGKCKFCSWPTLYPSFRVRSVTGVLDEIADLVGRCGIREIMDDSGTFPTGAWLDEFCRGMVQRGLNKKVALDCNMRFGAVSFKQYQEMKNAGFRLVLFGLESANQKTLDKIQKNVSPDAIVASCRDAHRAGLYPHITIMFGYPWETYEDALKTLDLGRWLLKKGYAYTVQATVVIPYPGTPLFAECKQENLLRTLDWDFYDMKMPVMKTDIDDARLLGLVQEIYKVAFDPEFIARRILSVRSFSDLSYFTRGAKKVLGHIFDFQKKTCAGC